VLLRAGNAARGISSRIVEINGTFPGFA